MDLFFSSLTFKNFLSKIHRTRVILLKKHASRVKQKLTNQSKLLKKEQSYIEQEIEKFLTELQLQQNSFVYKTQKGISFDLKDVISLEQVSDDTELKHIHIEFTDEMNDEYRDLYKTIFEICLTKYISKIDSHIIEKYDNTTNN